MGEKRRNSFRDKLFISQDAYASILGVSNSALNMYERDERNLPGDTSTLHREIQKFVETGAINGRLRNKVFTIDYREQINSIRKLLDERKEILVGLERDQLKRNKEYQQTLTAIDHFSKIPTELFDPEKNKIYKVGMQKHFLKMIRKMEEYDFEARTKDEMRIASLKVEIQVLNERITEAENFLNDPTKADHSHSLFE